VPDVAVGTNTHTSRFAELIEETGSMGGSMPAVFLSLTPRPTAVLVFTKAARQRKSGFYDMEHDGFSLMTSVSACPRTTFLTYSNAGTPA